MRDELEAILAVRPDFSPAHPVTHNPVMRKPPIPQGKLHVDEPKAAQVLDFGNAVYAFALRCLGRAFGEADDPTESRRALVNASLTAMRDLAPIMDLLARLPANTDTPGKTAGLTFTMQRSTVGFTQQKAAWALLTERAREIAEASSTMTQEIDGELGRIGQDFASIARTLEQKAPLGVARPPAPVTPSTAAGTSRTPSESPAGG